MSYVPIHIVEPSHRWTFHISMNKSMTSSTSGLCNHEGKMAGRHLVKKRSFVKINTIHIIIHPLGPISCYWTFIYQPVVISTEGIAHKWHGYKQSLWQSARLQTTRVKMAARGKSHEYIQPSFFASPRLESDYYVMWSWYNSTGEYIHVAKWADNSCHFSSYFVFQPSNAISPKYSYALLTPHPHADTGTI